MVHLPHGFQAQVGPALSPAHSKADGLIPCLLTGIPLPIPPRLLQGSCPSLWADQVLILELEQSFLECGLYRTLTLSEVGTSHQVLGDQDKEMNQTHRVYSIKKESGFIK